MAIPGERFQLNLDENDDFLGGPSFPSPSSKGFIGDIVEKTPTCTPIAPSIPSPATSSTGFPGHKKRQPRQSAFRQRLAKGEAAEGASTGKQQEASSTPSTTPSSIPEHLKSEKQRISEENQRRLEAMSPEEIERERQEIMANLSPALIQQLLKRATLDDENITPSGWNIEGSKLSHPTRHLPSNPSASASVSNPTPASASTLPPEPPSSSSKPNNPTVEDTQDPDAPGAEPLNLDERAPRTLPPSQTTLIPDTASSPPIHFPKPKPAPELDPDSPDFLQHLHEKYYPDLPSDPSKLSWMAPVSESEDMASYHPSLMSLPPSAIRFDFKGNLLPPRKARELPVHLGLHHHADAPGAAGYTIPELAHLARSSFPAQRCMAMQTLGRIMYRLGRRLYGEDEALNQGLWKCLHEGRVIEGLEEAAAGKGTGHLGIKAYATEALWNWQQGGGQRWKAQ